MKYSFNDNQQSACAVMRALFLLFTISLNAASVSAPAVLTS